MQSLNRYQIIGNLGKDAEVKEVAGATVISFSVAVTDQFKNKAGEYEDRTTWVNCSVWRQAGKSTAIADYLKKGTQVFCEGTPKARAYMDKNNQLQSSIELRVEFVKFFNTNNRSSSQSDFSESNEKEALPF